MNHARLPLLLTSLCFGSGGASAQTLQPPPSTGNWIISETTSPVDYTPLVIATARAKATAAGPRMELSIYCRAGQTHLVVRGPNISVHPDGYDFSYSVNGGSLTHAGAGTLLLGGIAMPGEVVSLLQTLPGEGEISIRLASRSGTVWEGTFLLDGLKSARGRLAIACNWPPATAKLRN